MPCDKNGNAVQNKDAAGFHHYKFFLTSYNSAERSNWAERPYFNPMTGDYTTGVFWSTVTQEIIPNCPGYIA